MFLFLTIGICEAELRKRGQDATLHQQLTEVLGINHTNILTNVTTQLTKECADKKAALADLQTKYQQEVEAKCKLQRKEVEFQEALKKITTLVRTFVSRYSILKFP